MSNRDIMEKLDNITNELLDTALSRAERVEAVQLILNFENTRAIQSLTEKVGYINNALKEISNVWGSDR